MYDSGGGDPGLFGPDSVTWRVHADPVLGLGGLRALLLQALHPVAMAGVATHSDFRDDPWGRLLRTVGYVEVVSFGTTEAAHRAGARVRGIHRPLRGTDEVTGREYRVEDHDLLRWVHCCLVDSFLDAFQRAGGGLSPAEADAYVGEQRRAAALVGLDPAEVPGSAGELREYYAAMRPSLVATPAARQAARFVLTPPMPARWLEPARPVWWSIAATSFAMLPRWARRMYRMPGLPATDLATSLALRTFRATLMALPQNVREAPAVRDARARVAGDPLPQGGQALRRRVERFKTLRESETDLRGAG